MKTKKVSPEKLKLFRLGTKGCRDTRLGGKCGVLWYYDTYARPLGRKTWKRVALKCVQGHPAKRVKFANPMTKAQLNTLRGR